MNRFALFDAMVSRKRITIRGIHGLVNGIEVEDGSGQSFMVTLLDLSNKTHRIYFRAS